METVEKTENATKASSHEIDEMFSVQDEDGVFPDIPTLQDQLSGTKKDGRSIGRLETMETKTNWESFINACDEFSTDSKKVIKYIKRKIKGRKGEKQTEVKTIHIVPDDDEAKWARRSANSAASRTSTDTAYSSCSTESRDNDGIEVVHDMAVDTPDTC
ncbi:uncharacterized protein LOC121382055 isoform X1 [Gigantopelta aegis]|uniref:uncharacterized protein LOC121382055 isoform X1 n=1 Tax=Gigantopelta aegis TaxID=1735272 RepID=UPI001B88E58C|nr:uncharacterized protein LOC121382055 isoform X1 [Gigantopelta aegis]